MSVSTLAQDLQPKLSTHSIILTDPSSQEFKDHLIRWGEVNIQIPGAIILAATEEDVIIIVQHAVSHSIPFVPKAGGYSTWSTIGKDGFILDLSLQQGFEIDVENATVRVQPGVLTKELNVGVAEKGFCVATPNARSIGVIPAFLGGGFSAISSIHGLGVDSLLSARIVTPAHGLVIANDTTNADLFWGIRGAGQAFGVVTEVTIKLHPLSTLSEEESGKFWVFTLMYTKEKLVEFATALETLVDGMSDRAMGVTFLAGPMPPLTLEYTGNLTATKPRFVVTTQYFGSESAARSALAPLFALNPIVVQKQITFDQITDSSDYLNAKGGYKYITSTGIRKIHADKLIKAFRISLDTLEKHPELQKSVVGMTFFNPGKIAHVPDESTAWGHRDVVGWAMGVPFTDDAETLPLAEAYAEDYLAQFRDNEPEKVASFPNHTRSRATHERYPGEWRVKKLQRLKQEWDPKGVFPQDFS